MNIEDRVARLIRPEIHELKAYPVVDSTGLIKLDAMENPYPWPAEIVEAWLDVLGRVQVNRYPHPDPHRLKECLREAMAIPANMEILLGNGSDELIQLVSMGLARPGSRVLAPVPTFVMYEVVAKSVGMEFIGVPLSASFELDLTAVCQAIETYRPQVIFLAYPNNPTGNLFNVDDIETIVDSAHGLVVIDEAYFPFTDTTFMDHLGQYDNLLILRTVSKLGLAGLRLGLLVADHAWVSEFNKLRLPYNVNSLTLASAEFALTNREFLDQQVARIRAERERLFIALEGLSGVQAWPSATNFILFQIKSGDANQIYDALYAAGVLVKNLNQEGVLKNCLRVTVGTKEENDAFLDALKVAL